VADDGNGTEERKRDRRRSDEYHGTIEEQMINRIIDFSAQNRVLIVVLTACLTLYGVWSMRQISLDAIPDLSDPQVIIYTEWPGRSPDLIEDQITYPIISAMLAAPHVSVVRGSSDYGFSYVYVIFDEGTDIYWGRTRVLEYMNKISGQLPEGVSAKLGPDATGVGWAFQYALVDKTGQNNLQQMRSFNDWYLRYWLESVPGVAEVATVGGFVSSIKSTSIPIDCLLTKSRSRRLWMRFATVTTKSARAVWR
jgi:copper/silver efflux system protein